MAGLRLTQEAYDAILSKRGVGRSKLNSARKSVSDSVLKARSLEESALTLLAALHFDLDKNNPVLKLVNNGLRKVRNSIDPNHTDKVTVPWESIEQGLFLLWLEVNLPDVFQMTTAIPMGGYRPNGSGGQIKGEGAKLGYPDVIIEIGVGQWHGLRIEMKQLDKTAVIRPDQKLWLTRLANAGYRSVCCYGHRSAIRVVCEYFGKAYPVNTHIEDWQIVDFNKSIS